MRCACRASIGRTRSGPPAPFCSPVRASGRARRLLRRIGADAVLGGGGYVAGPVGLAAQTMRLPLALTEADSHLGLTNRLLAPFARRVFLSFPLDDRRRLEIPRNRAAGSSGH